MISGAVAKPLLEASNLPLPVLGEIWNIADVDNSGFLNQFGFCVAMRLIAHAQHGEPINSSSANFASQSLAKFGSVQVNNTGSGVLKSHLQNNLQSQGQPQLSSPPTSQPRVASSNSIGSFQSHASHSTNSGASPSMIVPLLSNVQASNFGAMFDKTANNGVLPGEQARNIFLKARLPIPTLEQIWNLVDQNENGQLTRPQFIVAMHLIQCFMNKSLSVLPTALSEQLWKVAENAPLSSAGWAASSSPSGQHVSAATNSAPPSVPVPRAHTQPLQPPASQSAPLQNQLSGGNIAPSPTTNLNTWVMSSQQKKQYGAIYDTLDVNHQNVISSSTVANFLMTSKLPNQVLANIWELSNLDQSENFTKQEFSIAMYFVQKKLAGYELPEETPIELIQSSSPEDIAHSQAQLQAQQQPLQPPQSFQAAKEQAAPQRTASHMDDLLGIFQTAAPVAPAPAHAHAQTLASTPSSLQHAYSQPPPAPASRLSTQFTDSPSQFVPTSDFGKDLQGNAIAEDESSDDDDEGPENLDLPRVRGGTQAPAIPGRYNKPHFDSPEMSSPSPPAGSNYDAIKRVAPNDSSPTMFSSQPAGGFTNAASTISGATGAMAGVAAGALGGLAAQSLGGFTNSAHNSNTRNFDAADTRATNDQITQASVDIANYSNQVNSLSKQTSIVSGKKDKAQADLKRIMKAKEDILNKLNQLKALNEKETQQVIEVQNLMITSKQESDNLEKELSIAEANYHAEQTKKEQLQTQYEESQKQNQLLKEKLGNLNAEGEDLHAQIDELNAKLKQSNNLLAVAQQQVATQDAQNEELRKQVAEMSNAIFQIESKHQILYEKIDKLNDENLDLHEKSTDLSISHAQKTVDYSHLLADAASKGVLGQSEELIDSNVDEEVPTASLDDFEDDDFANDLKPAEVEKKEVAIAEPESSASSANSTMSKNVTENTTPTQTEASISTSAESAQQQQFSLPFNGATHSETSSTQNNPSQSVRGDLEMSPSQESASTIEETGPLSSQILPEGTMEDNDVSESSPEKTESFELVDHPDRRADQQNEALTDADPPRHQPSISNSEVETLSETAQEKPTQTPELEEFPPIQELEPLDDEDSSSDEDFQDASAIKESATPPTEEALAASPVTASAEEPAAIPEPESPALAPATVETSKNPFDLNGVPSSTVATANAGPSMFDDLGLEDAKVENVDAGFEDSAVNSGFNSAGFSFINNAPEEPTQSAGGDDWEQVFAGFGNDPNLQPAVVEDQNANMSFEQHFDHQPQSFGFDANVADDVAKAQHELHSEFSNAQTMAIEELADMGFDKDEAVAALQKNNWNIDDASNYLVDKA